MGEGEAAHRLADLLRLDARRAQEAAAGGKAAKRSRTVTVVPRLRARRAPLDHVAIAEAQHRPGGRAVRRGMQRHVRDRRDGGQRLAAEAERADAQQVVQIAQFARRVALEGESDFVRRDAAAVIGDADTLQPAAAHIHDDLPRPGIQRVLDQLLDDGGGRLDHLARGDPLRHERRAARRSGEVLSAECLGAETIVVCSSVFAIHWAFHLVSLFF